MTHFPQWDDHNSIVDPPKYNNKVTKHSQKHKKSRSSYKELTTLEVMHGTAKLTGIHSARSNYGPTGTLEPHLRTCAPSEDRLSLHIDAVWLQSSLPLFWHAPQKFFRWRPKTDQIARMDRLIWVFAGRTRHKVHYLMLWLNEIPLFAKKRYNWSTVVWQSWEYAL